MTVKILLIDDHQLFREGLRAKLSQEADLEVVGEAASARDGFRVAEETNPDVIVLDMVLPGMDGLIAIPDLRRRLPGVRILLLTVNSSETFAAQALSAGALGYALKDQPAEAVVEAIRAVAKGDRYLAPRLSLPVVERQMKPPGGRLPGPLATLSERELSVFHLVARGYSNDGIAAELCISRKTVETHRAHINKKLGVRGAAEVVRLAARHGLLME